MNRVLVEFPPMREDRRREPGDARQRSTQFVRDRVDEVASQLEGLLKLLDQTLLQLVPSEILQSQDRERRERLCQVEFFIKERATIGGDGQYAERLISILREWNHERAAVDIGDGGLGNLSGSFDKRRLNGRIDTAASHDVQTFVLLDHQRAHRGS
jgi:hypothetical protein